jgi:hypothetical protein
MPGEYFTSCKCLPCPPGTFVNTSGATSCQACLATQYSLPGSSSCNSCAMAEKLFSAKPPFARWHAVNWDSSNAVLRDSSGNQRHSVSTVYSGYIAVETETGWGASVSQYLLRSATWASIKLPPGSLPKLFTLCTMTRYWNGGGSRGRIINAFGANFFHGHDTTRRGVAYYGDGMKWVTRQNTVGTLENWLVMCAKNSGKAPNNVLVDGQPVGVADTAFTAGWQLGINTGDVSDSSSDWGFGHAIVWDQV